MPRKRMNGEGCYHKRPNGLWEWQIILGHQNNGRRKIKSIYARSQKELRKKVKQFKEDYTKKPLMDGSMPFSDWADIWYEGMKGQVSDRTYDSYVYSVKILKAHFGDTKLQDIKALHVENFLKGLIEEGRSPSYLKKLRGMMHQIMKKAEANELIYKTLWLLPIKLKLRIRNLPRRMPSPQLRLNV